MVFQRRGIIGIKGLANLRNWDAYNDSMYSTISTYLITKEEYFTHSIFRVDAISNAKTRCKKLSDFNKILSLLRKNKFQELTMSVIEDEYFIKAEYTITL